VNALVLALHEDDENSRQVSESLKLSGHKVILSKHFKDATELLKNRHVDLIISDVHLENGGNVFDFLRWVRRNPSTKTTPFIFFSSKPSEKAKYFEDGIRTSARLLGAAMYIAMEVFDSNEFRKKIDSLLPTGDQAAELTMTETGELK
jgi:CheY-like chemotaxis protein